MEAAKEYMDSDDEDLMTSIKPSEKALGKRKAAVEKPPNEEELGTLLSDLQLRLA